MVSVPVAGVAVPVAAPIVSTRGHDDSSRAPRREVRVTAYARTSARAEEAHLDRHRSRLKSANNQFATFKLEYKYVPSLYKNVTWTTQYATRFETNLLNPDCKRPSQKVISTPAGRTDDSNNAMFYTTLLHAETKYGIRCSIKWILGINHYHDIIANRKPP